MGAFVQCTSEPATPAEPIESQASAATCAAEWTATFQQTPSANNWWVEYFIGGGSVSSARLEVPGRADVPLELRFGKWVGSPGTRLETGTSVVLHAVDTAGRKTQSAPFGYLVNAAPKTATCPPAGSCPWTPSFRQESGANNWWIEYGIAGDAVASAALEVIGRGRVPLVFEFNKWRASTAMIATGESVRLHAINANGEAVASKYFGYLVETAPAADCTTGPPPIGDPTSPDFFATGEVDVTSVVRTAEERKAISPLIYGMNDRASGFSADVLRGVTLVRRGGDRSNAYNWETNVSNGSHNNGFANDMFLAGNLARPNAPGELDRVLIANDRAGGRATVVPFVLNDYVAGPVGGNIPYTTPGWDIGRYFRRVELVKPTPFSTTPDLNDGVVYTDEHIDFLNRAFAGGIFAPGPSQVMVGIDNEPDLYAYNFPMLQRGSGRTLYANGTAVGRQVTGAEFTAKFIRFARNVKQKWPAAPIVGPDHYHFDGFTQWWGDTTKPYSPLGRWYMDDFLAAVRDASAASGRRLLDTWDFHWYPQRVFNGTFTWALDHAARPMTAAEVDAVLQGPRSYWDTTYDEQSWITRDHLRAPAYIVSRVQDRISAGYPGTRLGVTEYFPGGCAHVSSALATADTLGVFGRMGVQMAAMWPHTCDLRWAFGGFRLLRNADGSGLRFADTSVRVEHPERAPSSVFAGSDTAGRVTVLVVNKANGTRRFGLRIANARSLRRVDAYRVDATHPNPFLATQSSLTKNNAWAYAAPPMSATLLVFSAD